jgi:hypothetical protein
VKTTSTSPPLIPPGNRCPLIGSHRVLMPIADAELLAGQPLYEVATSPVYVVSTMDVRQRVKTVLTNSES